MGLQLDEDSPKSWVYVDCAGFNLLKNASSMESDEQCSSTVNLKTWCPKDYKNDQDPSVFYKLNNV